MNNKPWNKKQVEDYTKAIKDYKSPKIIFDTIYKYLKKGSSILEIGSGTGQEKAILDKTYKVTGSEYSDEWLKLLPSDFIKIDMKDFTTKEKYDGIYSNKVIQQLSKEELKNSFICQYNALKPGGISIITFWYGIGDDGDSGNLYTDKGLKPLLYKFKIKALIPYDEMGWRKEGDDSMIIVLEK